MTAGELIIFDCDGVLIDSEPLANRVLCQALQDAGLAISLHEVWQRFAGCAEVDAKRICRDELGLERVDELFRGLGEALRAEFVRSLLPMPGMPELVRSLTTPKCVASNSGVDRLTRSLGLLDLWHEFAPHVFSAEMVARPKPAPDLFLHCARQFGVDPARCLVIDDSPHGITGAVAAGMRSIGFVDPADPRPDRQKVLAEAGATTIATGACELQQALEALYSGPALHPAAKLAVPA